MAATAPYPGYRGASLVETARNKNATPRAAGARFGAVEGHA